LNKKGISNVRECLETRKLLIEDEDADDELRDYLDGLAVIYIENQTVRSREKVMV
jgi:hypothetical protein